MGCTDPTTPTSVPPEVTLCCGAYADAHITTTRNNDDVGLQVLDVRDNKIRELGSGIARLKCLERLDVTNNDLNGIPPELARVKSIKSIVLDGNPIKSIRRDIIGKGTASTKQFSNKPPKKTKKKTKHPLPFPPALSWLEDPAC